MTVSVDLEICIGCTLCVQSCPEVFRMEEGKSVAYKEPVSEESRVCCRKAAEKCPVQAITVM